MPGRIPRPRTRLERSLAAGLAVAVATLAIAVIHRPEGIARLTILDVGQGDAILLEGSRGHRLLVDGGPDPGRLLVALDEHLPPWDRRVDVVVLSHPHEDHAAGLASLLDRYGVKTVLEPGMIGPGPGYAALNAALAIEDIERGILMTGDRMVVDDVTLRVLWPDPGSVPERPPDGGTGINNVSIVFLGEVAGHRFLLSGDIEEEIDPILLGRQLPQVEILKVAHHGSRTSSTGPFLAAVRPALAVISSGRGNPYGHPAPATVARIEAGGSRVLRTDTNGTVEIGLGPGPIRVRADRDVAALPVPTSLPAAAGTLGAAFLCGLPVRPPTSADSPVAGGAAGGGASGGGATSAGAASALAAASPAAAPTRMHLPAATRTLGYHRDRDFPSPGAPGCPTIAPDPPIEPRRLAHRRALGRTHAS